MPFQEKLDAAVRSGEFSPKFGSLLQMFHDSYAQALKKKGVKDDPEPIFCLYLEMVLSQLKTPYSFEPFHQSVTTPTDYASFGLNLFRPLIDFSHSKILGAHIIDKIAKQTEAGDNVILLANHQTEPDPQIIHLMTEKQYPKLASSMIFAAGHRVTTDPLAVPFSLGCNLLCIYSKRHIAHPPEQRQEKLQHNQRTMKTMSHLLTEGGKCIYMAPSGGRDRPSAQGVVDVAPFDPQSIEMFYLIAKQSPRPTHFYPLALSTYNILPPPKHIIKELGEPRIPNYSAVGLAFGEEIDMEHFPGSEGLEKRQKRQVRADYIWNIVKNDYQRILIK